MTEKDGQFKHDNKNPSDITEHLISLITQMSEDQQKTLLKALEQWLRKKKRQYPRKPLSTFVDFVSEGRSYREFTRNISEGGVYIETSTPFSIGKEILMTFSFPNSSNHLKLTGRIVRVEDSGIGVQFNISFLETQYIKSALKEI